MEEGHEAKVSPQWQNEKIRDKCKTWVMEPRRLTDGDKIKAPLKKRNDPMHVSGQQANEMLTGVDVSNLEILVAACMEDCLSLLLLIQILLLAFHVSKLCDTMTVFDKLDKLDCMTERQKDC